MSACTCPCACVCFVLMPSESRLVHVCVIMQVCACEQKAARACVRTGVSTCACLCVYGMRMCGV